LCGVGVLLTAGCADFWWPKPQGPDHGPAKPDYGPAVPNPPAPEPPQPGPNPDPQPNPKPTPPEAYPTALPVPGRPGFVFSPFNNKVIEVSGFESGALVADPHYPAAEKKYFRVP
jgi:hypothetical protein